MLLNDAVDQKICIDKKDRNSESARNCINLRFSADTPSDITCANSAPVVIPVDPPCAAQIGADGCTVINTAFGQIKTTPDTLLTTIFAIFLSLSGGIALLMIIRSGYQLITSQGNAEKVKEAQDRITSAIVGLLFTLFSLVILEAIGVDPSPHPGN